MVVCCGCLLLVMIVVADWRGLLLRLYAVCRYSMLLIVCCFVLFEICCVLFFIVCVCGGFLVCCRLLLCAVICVLWCCCLLLLLFADKAGNCLLMPVIVACRCHSWLLCDCCCSSCS